MGLLEALRVRSKSSRGYSVSCRRPLTPRLSCLIKHRPQIAARRWRGSSKRWRVRSRSWRAWVRTNLKVNPWVLSQKVRMQLLMIRICKRSLKSLSISSERSETFKVAWTSKARAMQRAPVIRCRTSPWRSKPNRSGRKEISMWSLPMSSATSRCLPRIMKPRWMGLGSNGRSRLWRSSRPLIS